MIDYAPHIFAMCASTVFKNDQRTGGDAFLNWCKLILSGILNNITLYTESAWHIVVENSIRLVSLV